MMLPLGARLWLENRWSRPLLWFLFHLETDNLTIAPVGPAFCRYRMWLTWQGGTGMVLGTYEPEVAALLRREITPGTLCIDIGAHIGYNALLMARLTGRNGKVIAFEPVPENFQMLQKNVTVNGLTNVQLEPLAVDDGEGSLRLTMRSDEEYTMTASTAGYAVDEQRSVIEVPTLSLDEYLARLGMAPDLLQIDVEGAELSVLHGAEVTLLKVRPKLLVEIHGWGTPKSAEVSEYLADLGYERTILGQRGSETFAFFRPCHQPAGIAAPAV
jgi:FkbM family methyltransferase